jgi:hypothetical protein
MTIQTIDELLKHELGIIENMNYPQAFIRTKTIINNTIHPRPSPASSAQPPVEEEIGAPQRGQDFAFSLTSLEQSGQ